LNQCLLNISYSFFKERIRGSLTVQNRINPVAALLLLQILGEKLLENFVCVHIDSGENRPHTRLVRSSLPLLNLIPVLAVQYYFNTGIFYTVPYYNF
jgi:hypothetical protein